MFRLLLILLLVNSSNCIFNKANAVSLYLSYDKQAQDIPLYQHNKSIDMSGYGVDISHAFNEQWSVNVFGQQSDADESQSSPSLQIQAEQQAFSGTVNYLFNHYSFSLSYHQLDFNLRSKESVDATDAKRLERFISVEDIQSSSIEVSVSRDIDFENAWLTIDAGISSIEQQAQYGNKLRTKGEDSHILAQELTEQSSDSWLFSSALSLSTLWSWGEIGFVPSARLSFTTVIAGDDVYLFNSVTGSARTGDKQRIKSQEQEPLTGDSAVIAGASLTMLIGENLYADVNINRFYADSTASNYFSVGLGWEF